MKIESVNTDHYLIPLPNTLTDAMHGEMTGFTVVMLACARTAGRKGWGTPTPSGAWAERPCTR